MINQFQTLAVLVVMACAAVFGETATAQTTTKGNPATATISGHVKVDDKPTSGVTVVLAPCDNGRTQNAAPVKTATTEKEGYYQLTGVPAGHYCVNAFAPVWVLQPKPGYFGVDMNIAAGETVENIDLALKKGGVITGRVLDSDGQPMIGDNVIVQMIDEKNGQSFSKTELTDDRGVYRTYGLPPGNYRVWVGSVDDIGGTARGGLRTHPTTYYAEEAGETNGAKAKKVPVTIDDESTDIDISVRPVSIYSVSGTVIDGQTGQPVPNIRIDCQATSPDGRSSRPIPTGQYTSDRAGAFLLLNLTAGHYSVRTGPTEGIDSYTEPLSFAIEDSNVTGLVLKTKKSGSISGVVVMNNAGFSGTFDAAAQMSGKNIFTSYRSPDGKTSGSTMTQIGQDGTFHVTGIPPGIVSISPALTGSLPVLRVVRVERGGAEIVNGQIPINAGEAISDIRVVVGSGTGVISGSVKIEGAPLTSGWSFRVLIRSVGSRTNVNLLEIDARGQFIIRDLIPGQYTLDLSVGSTQPSSPSGPTVKIDTAGAKKTVDVSDGVETPVTLTVVLTAVAPKEGGQ